MKTFQATATVAPDGLIHLGVPGTSPGESLNLLIVLQPIQALEPQERKSVWDALKNGPDFENPEVEQIFQRDSSLAREVDFELAP